MTAFLLQYGFRYLVRPWKANRCFQSRAEALQASGPIKDAVSVSKLLVTRRLAFAGALTLFVTTGWS